MGDRVPCEEESKARLTPGVTAGAGEALSVGTDLLCPSTEEAGVEAASKKAATEEARA